MQTAEELLATIKGHDKTICPACRKNLRTTALHDIVYTFEPCSCDVAPYNHLVETLWHRRCFKMQTPPDNGACSGESK
jgi:hypothetical protein